MNKSDSPRLPSAMVANLPPPFQHHLLDISAFNQTNADLCMDDHSLAELRNHFLGPIGEYLNRPRKNIRSAIVRCGYLLGQPAQPAEDIASLQLIRQSIESLHAGSLIIDDIQDGSVLRRGQPAYHVTQGEPQAIAAGNWLYFWSLRLISRVKWETPEKRILAYERFHRTMEHAHYGQYLDLAIKSDITHHDALAETSLTTARLKTGSVFGLAMVLGYLASPGNPADIQWLDDFGNQLGVLLQRLDDWSNLLSYKNPEKRFEDLIARKPTTVWCDIYRDASNDDRTAFLAAVAKLPHVEDLLSWTATTKFIHQARASILAEYDRQVTEAMAFLGSNGQANPASDSVKALATKTLQGIKEDLIHGFS